MRKLIVTNLISLDGFVAGAGDDLSKMPFGPGFSEYNLERLKAADTLLVGRKSFENFRSHWPSVADDPSQPAGEREISRLNNAIEKVVVTDTLAEDQLNWPPSRVVRPANMVEEVNAIKASDGRDILVFGSRQLWNALLKAGLVDELHLIFGPGLVGSGVPAFTNSPQLGFELRDLRRLDETGLVLAVYSVAV